ncbi:MAG: hypothetical protein UEW60_10165, partial [Christensenellales bacterium]|nr:hypothetical protein [Christensenellales bacterium]
FLSRHFVVAYLCCTSFSPPSAKFPCSKSHLGLDFLFAGFRLFGTRYAQFSPGRTRKFHEILIFCAFLLPGKCAIIERVAVFCAVTVYFSGGKAYFSAASPCASAPLSGIMTASRD